MMCSDTETSSPAERQELAERLCRRQVALLGTALGRILDRFPGAPSGVMLGGSGEFLGEMLVSASHRLAKARIVSLARELGEAASHAACAYALVHLMEASSWPPSATPDP